MLSRSLLLQLDQWGVGFPLRRLLRQVRPSRRKQQRLAATSFEAFLKGANPAEQFRTGSLPRTGKVLVVGYEAPSLATFQTPLILAARVAGREVAVLLSTRHCAAAAFYQRIGANVIVERERFASPLPMSEAAELVASAVRQDDLLAIQSAGIPCGKFAVSTLMRRFRIGSVDPQDPILRSALVEALARSMQAAVEAQKIVKHVQPELVCFYDRGYTPDGELFEAALAGGAHASTLNAGHRSGTIICKRYSEKNKHIHFGKPSPRTWASLEGMTWNDAKWRELRSEIEGCYKSGQWYDEVGTQFGTRVLDRREVIEALGLDSSKRTAVIFPHLFWDATFFWGTDLFPDYRVWFMEAVRAAAANKDLNWIVKIHPANSVKNRRDGYTGVPSELVAISEAIGAIPDHVKIVTPSSSISTLAVLDVLDYCLTVRGTVGIEAALFGKQVLTAGTGRYDGFGFSIDSSSPREYLDRLACLQHVPPPTAAAVEQARRYAYGLFKMRPLETQSVRFLYHQDAVATLETQLHIEGATALDELADIRCLARWIGDPEMEDLIQLPEID